MNLSYHVREFEHKSLPEDFLQCLSALERDLTHVTRLHSLSHLRQYLIIIIVIPANPVQEEISLKCSRRKSVVVVFLGQGQIN